MYNHLLINHLPEFATLFGAILAVLALVLGNSTLRYVAFSFLIVGGLSFYPAFETGEKAHHEIEERPDFDKTSHHLMHEHEEAAEFAAPFMYGLALLGLIGLALETRKSPYAKGVVGAAGVAGIVLMFLLAKVANTGGQIRHPEIRKAGTETKQTTKDDD